MDKIILIMVICFSKTITRGSWGTIRTGLSPRKQKIRLITFADTDRQILSCRAYFSVPYLKTNAEAHVRAFVHHFGDEETTGILEVSAEADGTKDDAWYSLSGMRLNGKPAQRGLYIHQGKKVVIP